jgi:hypothetical protein
MLFKDDKLCVWESAWWSAFADTSRQNLELKLWLKLVLYIWVRVNSMLEMSVVLNGG